MTSTHSLRDRFGLSLTTNSTKAAQSYIEGIDLLLSYNLGLDLKFQEALHADENFALAHTALAVVYQLRGNLPEAQASIIRASDLTDGVTKREQQHVTIVATVINGQNRRALELIREHLTEFPQDALLLFQANSLLMYSGYKDRHQQALALLEPLQSKYGEDWWFLGLLSFVKHELGRFEESRRLSEHSLALYPRNANAVHNLAHVFYETVDLNGGVTFLDTWLTDYHPQAPFYCHLVWHKALFELSAGRYEQALALFDQGIRGNIMSRSALPDAASLLWRLYLYGYTKTLPWDAASTIAVRLAPRPGFGFNDAHAAFVHAVTGNTDALKGLVDGWRVLAAQGQPIASPVVIPLIEGINAYASGDYAASVKLLEPVMSELVRLGGSHAQREVFEDTLVMAYIRAGHFQQAENLLRRRLDQREWARDFLWLNRVQTATGNLQAARANLQKGRQQWSAADPDAPEFTNF